MHFGAVFFYYSYKDHFLIKFKLLLQREAWDPRKAVWEAVEQSFDFMDVRPDRFTPGHTASWNENPAVLASCPGLYCTTDRSKAGPVREPWMHSLEHDNNMGKAKLSEVAKSVWLHGSYRWGWVWKNWVDRAEEGVLGRWLPEEVLTVSTRYLMVGRRLWAPGKWRPTCESTVDNARSPPQDNRAEVLAAQPGCATHGLLLRDQVIGYGIISAKRKGKTSMAGFAGKIRGRGRMNLML